MTVDDIIAALAIPPDARVEQRVPKKLFLEQGAPTAADKRAIQDGIEDVHWIAALKPDNIGVAAFRDGTREYLEVAVLTMTLRTKAKTERLIELVHRAIPYPLLLIAALGETLSVSAAHKRASLGEEGKTVLNDTVVAVTLPSEDNGSLVAFLQSLRLADQPRDDLFRCYQGWIDRIHAMEAAGLTGTFKIHQNTDVVAARRAALDDHARLTREIASLRTEAAKETQMNRRVDLNLAIKRLEAELAAATAKL